MKSLVDWTYCKYANRNPFFPEGWGETDLIRHLLKKDVRVLDGRRIGPIRIEWLQSNIKNGIRTAEGRFKSPFIYKWKRNELLPDFAQQAYFLLLEPTAGADRLVIHFAATGDEGYSRRKMICSPLLKHGIAQLILESPYYGKRRNPEQKKAVLPTVLSLMQMSRAALDEGIALARWARANGYKDIMFSGISMGGYQAAAAARECNFATKVTALVPSHSAAPVYTEAALKTACDWPTLYSANPIKDMHPLLLMRKILSISDMNRQKARSRSFRASIIGAQKDAYIPEYSVEIVHDSLPGSTLEWIRTGHVGAFLLGAGLYRRRILELFESQ